MKILFLCNKSPWPPKEGGPMAMNMFIEGLVRQGHEVRVLAVNSHKYNVSHDEIPEAYRRSTNIELISLNLRLNPIGAVKALASGKSYHVSRFDNKLFHRRLRQVLQENSFDILQLESLFMAPYISTIRAFSEARIVLRAHNIEHLVWERVAAETSPGLKKWYISHLAAQLRDYEEQSLSRVDAIIPITDTDAGYFITVTQKLPDGDRPRILTIPFGVDTNFYSRMTSETTERSLFSLGSMNWIPNQEGVRWFLNEVWPSVHQQFPTLRYYIAGRAMPDWMLKINAPNVVVLGEIPDASEFLAAHEMMIVPLFSGSGIRIKIIEGMAAGKTVISTTVGAEGVKYTHMKNIMIADAPCEFFEMISICMSDMEITRKIGQAAKALITEEYDANALVAKLVSFYRELIS